MKGPQNSPSTELLKKHLESRHIVVIVTTSSRSALKEASFHHVLFDLAAFTMNDQCCQRSRHDEQSSAVLPAQGPAQCWRSSRPCPSSTSSGGTTNAENSNSAMTAAAATSAATSLDDLNVDTLSTVYSYLPRRNDWTSLSSVNRNLHNQYRSGLQTLTPPPWPSCKALYDPVSLRPSSPPSNATGPPKSARARRRDDAAGEDAALGDDDVEADDDDVPDFFDDDNPHHPLQLCCFSVAPSRDRGDGGSHYLAVADKEGNLQLWHRCLGLIKAWNVMQDQGEGSCEQDRPCRSPPPLLSITRTRGATIGKTKPTLRYVALKKDHGSGGKGKRATETTIPATDELLFTMDSEGTLKVWRIHLMETSDDGTTCPQLHVTFVKRSVGQWEPRMFVTPTGDIILIKKMPQIQHHLLDCHVGMIRLTSESDPILGHFMTLEMDRTTHHLPIHFEVSGDQRHFLIYATKRKTPTSASVEFVLQTNHHGINHLDFRGGQPCNFRSSGLSQQEWQEQMAMPEQHILQGTGTYHIQCETPQILEEQIERTCAASFFHRAALSPDGKTVAVVEFGSGGGGQQPAIRGAVRLVFRNTSCAMSEERWLISQQQSHRRRERSRHERDTPSSSGGRRFVLLPSHSRYIKMSFSQDSQYLLVQFRHRARLGRSMKLYCRNLIVNVTSGRVLTSFAPFASHAKSCEYFNHGPYRQLNSVRGTKVLFVPNGTSGGSSLASVLSAGFVSVEKDGTHSRDLDNDYCKGGREEQHPWSTLSCASHSQSTNKETSSSTHVPGFSITNIDLKQREQTRLELMNLSIEELVRGIQVKLHRARIPSAISSSKGRIVDWILQLHDYEDVVPMLDWASSSASSFSSSLSSLSFPAAWDDDASSSSRSRRDSIDSNSSDSESSVVSA